MLSLRATCAVEPSCDTSCCLFVCYLFLQGLDCVRKMMKSEGPFSLYKGTIAPLLGNMVLLGIHFPTFMKTRAYLEQGDAPGAFTPWKILAAGAAAGAAGSVVSTPTELIRTKMQMVRKNNILAQMKGAAVGGLNPEENYKVRAAGVHIDSGTSVKQRSIPADEVRPALLRKHQGKHASWLS
jgi:hypothetical protein